MHRDTPMTGTGRRNTEPNINSTFLSDPNLGQDELRGRIDGEIRRVSDNIFKLVMQRTLLMRRRNTLSPAVNLPPELLALIFEYACSPNNNENGNWGEYDERHYSYSYPFGFGPSGLKSSGTTNLGVSVGAGAVTPLFLGSICHVWRRVSQNTSRLWDTITVCVKNNRRAASQATLLRAWLKRSGQRPLTIKLLEDDFAYDGNGDGDENDQHDNDSDNDWGIDVTSTSIIEALAAHSQQWHTIDLFLPSSWKPTLSKIKHTLPRLINATLRAAESCPSLSRVDTFVHAPHLHEVRLVGYSVTDVSLPWSQLARLDGDYFSPAECLDTLHRGTSLRRCQFEQLYRGGVYPFLAHPIRHECLESLELIMDIRPTHELESLFNVLTLPNLTELVLSLSSEGDEDPGEEDVQSVLTPVIPLMRRSQFKLERLHLVGVTPSESDLMGFLKEQPTLKALLLINPVTETGGTLSKRFIEAMMPGSAITRSNIVANTDPDMDMDVDVLPSTPKKRDGWSAEKEEGIEEEEQDSYLIPMLEHLEYQGATSFSTQALTELLVRRWRVGRGRGREEIGKGKGRQAREEREDEDEDEDEEREREKEKSPTPEHNPLSHSSSPPPPLSPYPPTSPRIHSTSLSSFISAPPPLAPSTTTTRSQLHSVIITTTKKIKFSCADAQIVQGLIREGMHLDFLADINGHFV